MTPGIGPALVAVPPAPPPSDRDRIATLEAEVKALKAEVASLKEELAKTPKLVTYNGQSMG